VVPYWALGLSYSYWMRATWKLDIILIGLEKNRKIRVVDTLTAGRKIHQSTTICILIGFNDSVVEATGRKHIQSNLTYVSLPAD
jgi:hypothetical protein